MEPEGEAATGLEGLGPPEHLVEGGIPIPGKIPGIFLDRLPRGIGRIIVHVVGLQGMGAHQEDGLERASPLVGMVDVPQEAGVRVTGGDRDMHFALTNVTTPYLERIAAKGAEAAFAEDPTLAAGVNTYRGKRTGEEWDAFMVYTKRVWFSNGIHHHYATKKFEPCFCL